MKTVFIRKVSFIVVMVFVLSIFIGGCIPWTLIGSLIAAAISVVSYVAYSGWTQMKWCEFCAAGYEYFALARHSHSVALARENWKKGIQFLKDRNLTKGNTGVFWKNPDNDLGFFCTNVLEVLNYLDALPDNFLDPCVNQNTVSESEESGLVSHREDFVRRLASILEYVPDDMHLYPNGYVYAAWKWVSVSLIGISVVGCVVAFVISLFTA